MMTCAMNIGGDKLPVGNTSHILQSRSVSTYLFFSSRLRIVCPLRSAFVYEYCKGTDLTNTSSARPAITTEVQQPYNPSPSAYLDHVSNGTPVPLRDCYSFLETLASLGGAEAFEEALRKLAEQGTRQTPRTTARPLRASVLLFPLGGIARRRVGDAHREGRV